MRPSTAQVSGQVVGRVGQRDWRECVTTDQVAELLTEVGHDGVSATGGFFDVGARCDLYSIVVQVVTAAQVMCGGIGAPVTFLV
jgi:hypothetical protein